MGRQIDDDSFSSASEPVLRYNDEGEIVGVCGDAAEGSPFTDRFVSRMLAVRAGCFAGCCLPGACMEP